jgi:colicin import membrane protein
MNRLQKKCVLATAGVHLLLLVILLVGPAFFQPRHPADNMPILDVIPANLIDAAFNSGVRNAQPPPPVAQPVPQPLAPQPQPVVTPRAPTPSPEKTVKPEAAKPQPTPDQRHRIEPNLRPEVRTAPRNVRDDSQRARALRNAIRNLKNNFSPGTTVDMPGNSSAAYANYADAVKSVYDQAWTLPDTIASDNENVKVSVTIASDGAVVSARIIEPSGDSALDASVQRTLERVTFIAPFPEGTTDKQRTYTINFNPQVKQMLE